MPALWRCATSARSSSELRRRFVGCWSGSAPRQPPDGRTALAARRFSHASATVLPILYGERSIRWRRRALTDSPSCRAGSRYVGHGSDEASHTSLIRLFPRRLILGQGLADAQPKTGRCFSSMCHSSESNVNLSHARDRDQTAHIFLADTGA